MTTTQQMEIKTSERYGTHHRKNEVSEMIENKNDASKNLEIALQTLEQANNV